MINDSPSKFVKRIKKGYLPAWAILVLSMSVTVLLWHNARYDINRDARIDFDFRAEEIKLEIVHRMRGYEQVLRGGVGLFKASENVTRSEWKEYVKSLEIEKSYPGIQGIGFSVIVPSSERKRHIQKIRFEGLPKYSVWPEGERPVYTSIIYLEPLDWRNQRAIGYDMYSEPVRKEAMDKAVDANMAAISGKVTLVQETEKDVQAGFLMYLPVYRKGMPTATAAQRREAIIGFVYSPFRMNDLMRGIIGRKVPDLDVHIFDGDHASDNSLMYDSDFRGELRAAVFHKTFTVVLNGNTWTISFSSLPAFDAAIDREKPVIVLTAGTVISLLFFAIAFFLVTHRARLHNINEDLNNEVAERKRAEDELRRAHDGLEVRVMERTEELTQANSALQKEISVRRQAETALRESEDRFRSLVETTNDWVWEVDENITYTYASPMVRGILGYSPDEIIGKTPFDHMDEKEAARFRAAMTGFIESKKPFILEMKNLRKDGSAAVLETSGAPIIGLNGEFLGYRGIDRDVTERKRIEKEREKMQEQLIQSQKMELMGRLAGGVAHDFNNIMTIITSLNNLAKREAQAAPVLRDYLDQIQAASERAMNLTRQLLIFSRNQPTKTAVLDINRTVDEMLRLLRHILGENITVKSDLAPDLFPVQADKSNIEQLVMNLVVNSKEAMPRGGEIAITTENVAVHGKGTSPVPEFNPGNYVCIKVRDSGVGMEEKMLKQVFEPFFSTKETGKGIGLGLTVVHDIVKEYKGGISVSSRPGEGTCFNVYLPASSAPMPKPSSSTRVEEPQGRGERILLLEDEVMLCKSVSLVLTKSGYNVFAASDAEEAVRMFQENDFHLVFSDVVLKGRSGVNVVDELLAVRPGLKVVFASGYMNIDSQWPYIREKGFRFLQKPYEIPELLMAIRECLDGE